MASDETVVARLRPHGRALFWPTVLLLIVAGGAAYLAGTFREQWQVFVILGVGGALLLFGWLLPLLRWSSRNYTITSRRTVVRSGILIRSRQELLHSRARDVTLRRGALQTMFRSGDVIINLGSESPVELRDVPSATLVQEALHDLMESTAPAYDELT